MDLNTQYESPFGGAGQQAVAGVQTPPNSLEQLLGLLMPYLMADQKNRSSGVNTMVRALQTLRGGGRRDSLTGGIMNPDPLVAQQEHDAYWNSLFTSPAQAIAKERARFDPEGLRPNQQTFTQQSLARMNMTPQDKVNAAMGPGWAGMAPVDRRVALQQMHGQMPDFQDPTGRGMVAQGQQPQPQPQAAPVDQTLAATLAGTPAPTPLQRPQAQAPQAPTSAAPSPAGPPQASAVSPQFDVNQLLKTGPPIMPMFGQNPAPYGPQASAGAPDAAPWMYGVGQLRAPMDFTPDMLPVPNYAVKPKPYRYGVGYQ